MHTEFRSSIDRRGWCLRGSQVYMSEERLNASPALLSMLPYGGQCQVYGNGALIGVQAYATERAQS